jgi:centrosomal protein CEP135
LESSALAEKLLNDLLKTTEGFQKLKKINESLQSQVSKDTLYYEPLKKENERVVKENNELHLKLIHLQEQLSQVESTAKAQVKQLTSEKSDMQFLSSQKDLKIQQLGAQIVELQGKLEKVL